MSAQPSGKPNPPRPGGRDAVALTVAICLGIIRDQRMRRSVIFFTLLGVMAMLFAGFALFDGWLAKRPFLFLIYWAACAWFTFLTILMALYDMLMVRKSAMIARRRLAEQMHREVSEAAEREEPPKS